MIPLSHSTQTEHADPKPPDPVALAVDAKTLGKLLGLSTRTIRTMDAAGKLPNPLHFGRAVRWSIEEIRAWIAAKAPDRRTWEIIKSEDAHNGRTLR